MALESAQRAFGFGCGLDWRPTVFVNGIPSNRVCSACGLVPSNIALLPCRHLLCQSCYDRCASNGSRCCLDGEAILADDVLWSATSADSILARKIRCWNAPWGCGVTGPASEVLQHFISEYEHHTVTCLRCKGSVAHRDIVNHLVSGVCVHTSGTECVTGGDVSSGAIRITSALSNLDAKVSLLQRSLEENLKSIVSGSGPVLAQKATAESSVLESIQCLENTLIESARLCRGAVDQMSDAHAALRNDIGAVMSSLQGIKDEFGMLGAALKQTFEDKSSNIKESIDKLETAGTGERKEVREKLEAIEKMMQDLLESEAADSKCSEECPDNEAGKTSAPESVADFPLEERLNVSEALEWTIQPWSEAKMKSNRKGLEFVLPPKPGYFYGYHISPYAVLKRSGKSQLFHLGFQIITGECDNLLAWPMKKTLRLTLLHPTESGKAQSIVSCTACANPDSNPSLGLQTLPQSSAVSIDVMKLEESGFVKDDKLSLRFEVLQCSTPNSHAGPQF